VGLRFEIRVKYFRDSQRSREKGYLSANEVYDIWLLSEYTAMMFVMSVMFVIFAIFAIFSRAFLKGFRRFARFAMMIG